MSSYTSELKPSLRRGNVQPAAVIIVKNLNRLLDERAGMSTALAEFCGVNPSAVTKWRGGESFPSPNSLDKIAAFFKLPVKALFEDDLDPRSTGLELDKAIRIVSAAAKKGGRLDTR